MSPFLSAYFARTGWQQPVQVNIDTLRGCIYTITAPSLSKISMSFCRVKSIWMTGVWWINWSPRVGGYCFEQNGLFERVLREVGFTVRSVLGRVVLANPSQMPPRTHRLLLVELNGERWIADVGFGGQTLTAPIRLIANEEQDTPHGSYRLLSEGNDWVLQFRHHEHWQSMYHFDTATQYFNDYVMGNFWSAHWPQSHFRHHLLMCRHLPDGAS